MRGSSFGVVAAVDRALAHAGIAEVGEVGVVELDVAAPGRVEQRDLVAVHLGEVVEEAVEVGVRLDVDPGPAAAEVGHRGRRDGDLGEAAIGCVGGHELVVGDLDRALVGQRCR